AASSPGSGGTLAHNGTPLRGVLRFCARKTLGLVAPRDHNGVLHRFEERRMSNVRALALTFLAVTFVYLSGCASSGGTRQNTATELDRILAGDQRSEESRARDQYRHPKQTLLFFGIRPNMKVVEVWPGGGWYTEILAPLLRDKGTYYAATVAPDPGSKFITN